MRDPWTVMRMADTVSAMSTDASSHGGGNYAAVIDEIYAEMGRRRINQVALGHRLGRPQPWVNRRLMGHTLMTFPELEDIATALGLTVWDLLARAARGQGDVSVTSGGPDSVTGGGRSTGWFHAKRAKRRQRLEVALHISPDTHPGAYRDSPERVNLRAVV